MEKICDLNKLSRRSPKIGSSPPFTQPNTQIYYKGLAIFSVTADLIISIKFLLRGDAPPPAKPCGIPQKRPKNHLRIILSYAFPPDVFRFRLAASILPRILRLRCPLPLPPGLPPNFKLFRSPSTSPLPTSPPSPLIFYNVSYTPVPPMFFQITSLPLFFFGDGHSPPTAHP